MAANRKLTYYREQKDFDLMPEKKSVNEHIGTEESIPVTQTRTLPGYEKAEGVLSYNIVCVISGGEHTERIFLQELIRQKNLHSLRVAFVSKEGQGLQPYQMQDEWAKIQQTKKFTSEGQRYKLDDADKVYLLSDVDEFYDQLVKIINERSNSDVGQWIISNPCFEIWLYYCFKNEPLTDLSCIEPLSVDKRSQKLKQLGEIVVNGGFNPCLAFERMADGISNSLEHYAEDEHSIPVLFATQMHQMAQYLIDTMNRNANEYDEFVRQKREWREKMRKGV